MLNILTHESALYRESLHLEMAVDDVSHLVEEPLVNLSEFIEHVVRVAGFQRCRQHKHPLICRI